MPRRTRQKENHPVSVEYSRLMKHCWTSCYFSCFVLLQIQEIWKDGLKKPLPSSWDERPENGTRQHLCWVKRNPACGRGKLCLPHREELTTTDFTEMTGTVKSSLYLSTVPADEMSSALFMPGFTLCVTGPWACRLSHSVGSARWSGQRGLHCSCNAVCCAAASSSVQEKLHKGLSGPAESDVKLQVPPQQPQAPQVLQQHTSSLYLYKF